jgi:hypothetical protein
VLKANANGFIIAQRDGLRSGVTIGQKDASGKLVYEVGNEHLSLGTSNAGAITEALRGGKYRGFSIVDPSQSDPQKTNARKHLTLFGWSCQKGSDKYTKDHIDRFRDFLKTNIGQDSGEATEKQKCFGFEITDISTRGYYQDRPGCEAKIKKTKITYDI